MLVWPSAPTSRGGAHRTSPGTPGDWGDQWPGRGPPGRRRPRRGEGGGAGGVARSGGRGGERGRGRMTGPGPGCPPGWERAGGRCGGRSAGDCQPQPASPLLQHLQQNLQSLSASQGSAPAVSSLNHLEHSVLTTMNGDWRLCSLHSTVVHC